MKDALQGLIRGYSTHTVLFDDFIEGKGRVLVFLLHGPPGCGKTMTAGKLLVTDYGLRLTIPVYRKHFRVLKKAPLPCEWR